jgi:hypothetical protein
VLQCISHLGRLQNMGSGGVDDDKFFIGEEGAPRDESKSLFRIQSKADVSLCWLLCIYVTFPCDDSLIVSILG